ncbi:hypothetical protein ACFYPC_24980 [Streptomyces sp. NPDC005808]|uniref:hypothetical protein n=1 Tax=Streptomyces sp. NPDC005808 TaxID=3364734 RepID=UPI003683F2F8
MATTLATIRLRDSKHTEGAASPWPRPLGRTSCSTPLHIDLGQAPAPPVNSLMRTTVTEAGVTGVAGWRGIGRGTGMSWTWTGIPLRVIRTGCANCRRICRTSPMMSGMRCV